MNAYKCSLLADRISTKVYYQDFSDTEDSRYENVVLDHLYMAQALSLTKQDSDLCKQDKLFITWHIGLKWSQAYSFIVCIG